MAGWRKALLALSVVVALLAACGEDSAVPNMSPEALQGRDLAMSKGCAACHGDRGEGGVGPSWIGLAGSDVELVEGVTVMADAEYLQRSITDPEAQVVAGFTITMPTTKLTEPEVSALIAYIEELE